MNVLPAGPDSRPDRPASAVLYDQPDARIVGFHLLPGQRVAEHRSPSTVTVHVTEGVGIFSGEDGSARLEAGQVAVYAPDEMHAMEAGDRALRFLAIITPRPGG